MKRVLLAAALLTGCGCQSAPPAADRLAIAPPSVLVVPAAPAGTSSQSQAASAPTMPTIQTMQDANASTIAFLRALAQAIHAKQQADMAYQAGTVGVGLDWLQQSRNQRRDPNNPNDAPQPLSLDGMTRLNQKHLAQTTAILETLARTPVPPDCQRLMLEYRTLYQMEAVALEQIVQNKRTGTEVSREAEQQQRLEIGRRVLFINQEIERIRTSTASIAEQVPRFIVPQ